MASILLIGASGFIGASLLESLTGAGHNVTCAVRHSAGFAPGTAIEVDYTRDYCASDWRARLAGIEIVVNAVGILRERPPATFEAVHVAAPRALFTACLESGVRKVVQISALGADADAASRYHVTKRQADDALAGLGLDWIIVQPSLVYGRGGASARFFGMLAALPLVPLPGSGEQRVQPIHVDDLTALIVRVIETREFDRMRICAVGPRELTLSEMLGALRRAMGFGKPHFLRVPMPLVRAAARLGELMPGALLDRDTLGMLERGNTASPQLTTRILGRSPRPIERFIPARDAQPAANDGRLAWLLPLLRASVAAVWIVTGILSLGIYPVHESYALLARVGLTGAAAALALYGAALIDVALGVAVYAVRRRIWVWRLQLLLIVGYTGLITLYLPEYWLHPFGPVLKNLPLVVAILMLHEFDARAGGQEY
jgi:uncharacterized protein YbjT (DUF2867 family)